MSIFNYLKNSDRRRKLLLIVSGLFITTGLLSLNIWQWNFGHDTLMIAATILAGYEIVVRALRGLRNRHTNIELLVSMAAIGGLSIGIFWESAAVTFLFIFGAYLEERSLNRTRSTLKNLIALAPATATVFDNNGWIEISSMDVEKGMLVLVKPGGKIPVDGIVENGRSVVYESPITGEPLPVEKETGAYVYAGTLNQNGLIKVRASRAGTDTTLAKIIRRVEEAQEAKAPAQRFIEKFAKWYTPAIVGLSITAFSISGNLELALTLLVIGCPGALVISTPVSIIAGIGRAAKNGILIKGGEYLESAGIISAIAFDKTGTLTEGKPKLTDIVVTNRLAVTSSNLYGLCGDDNKILTLSADEPGILSDDQKSLLYWTAVAESGSEHPLAQAVIEKAGEYFSIPEPDSFISHTGSGIWAEYESNSILVGKRALIERQDIDLPDFITKKASELEKGGRTVIYTAVNNVLLGIVGISDTLRADASKMVKQLKRLGIERILMLTGDTVRTAHTIAREAGIDEVHAGLLPEDKLEFIKKLQSEGGQVAMVGDGINDAPALAAADIGIAMGAAGTDVAIETADIALMTDNLLKLPEALHMSRITLRNIYQNVFIALLTVSALLAGVLLGEIHMAGGMLIHELSVMLVIINAMRLQRIKLDY
jgi:Zn2+/Cd2+-exporting ATPase